MKCIIIVCIVALLVVIGIVVGVIVATSGGETVAAAAAAGAKGATENAGETTTGFTISNNQITGFNQAVHGKFGKSGSRRCLMNKLFEKEALIGHPATLDI